MATGDKKNAIEKLRHELESIKFDFNAGWDVEAVASGDPRVYMAFARYAALGFSRSVSTHLTVHHSLVDTQTDVAFMENVFRLLRREFQQQPALSVEQFFQAGFVEHKALLCRDLIKHCKRLHNDLYKQRKAEKEREAGRSSKSEADTPKVSSLTLGEVALDSLTRSQWAEQGQAAMLLRGSRGPVAATAGSSFSPKPPSVRSSSVHSPAGVSPATLASPSTASTLLSPQSPAISPPAVALAAAITIPPTSPQAAPSVAEFQRLVALVEALQQRVGVLEQQVVALAAERQTEHRSRTTKQDAPPATPQLVPRHGSLSLSRPANTSVALAHRSRGSSTPPQRPVEAAEAEGRETVGRRSPAPVNGGSWRGEEAASSVPATVAKIMRTQELLKGHGIDLSRIAASRPPGNPLATASSGPFANPLAGLI